VYYQGLNPKQLKLSARLQGVWHNLPRAIATIYENLHNGWFHYSSRATGYVCTQDMEFLGDLLDLDDTVTLPFNPDNCITLFQNGGGAYVCFDVTATNKTKGFTWWNDEDPELDEELCPLIDEWTVIGLEA
jgi:hypothetical protein